MKSESRSNGREWIKGRKEREGERESGVWSRADQTSVETTQKVDDSSAVGPPLTGEPPPKP